MKVSKEFKIGGLTILAILLLMWGNSFLKGKKIFNPQTKLYVVYDNVNGLVKTNPVTLNGLKIGQVQSVDFLENQRGDLLVTFFIDCDFPIPKNSYAKLVSNGLLGSKAIQIVLGDAQTVAISGDTLLSDKEAGIAEQVQPIANKLGNIIEQMDSILMALNHLLNEQTQEDLIQSIEDLQISLRHIASITEKTDMFMKQNTDHLNNIVCNTDSFITNLKSNNDKLTKIIHNFSSVSDTLAKSNLYMAINNLTTTLQSFDSILTHLQKGEGTAGKLLTNDSLYFELNRSAEQLHLLLEDIRKNPKKYVRFSVF